MAGIGDNRTILKVGSGIIKNRLRAHLNDPKVQPYKLTLLSGSLKHEADETLFLELAHRGYDLSKPLRTDAEEPTVTAEIVKIG